MKGAIMKTIFNQNYYTIRELADESGLAYSTIHRWVQELEIELKVIGKRSYLTEQQYKDFINRLK